MGHHYGEDIYDGTRIKDRSFQHQWCLRQRQWKCKDENRVIGSSVEAIKRCPNESKWTEVEEEGKSTLSKGAARL